MNFCHLFIYYKSREIVCVVAVPLSTRQYECAHAPAPATLYQLLLPEGRLVQCPARRLKPVCCQPAESACELAPHHRRPCPRLLQRRRRASLGVSVHLFCRASFACSSAAVSDSKAVWNLREWYRQTASSGFKYVETTNGWVVIALQAARVSTAVQHRCPVCRLTSWPISVPSRRRVLGVLLLLHDVIGLAIASHRRIHGDA